MNMKNVIILICAILMIASLSFGYIYFQEKETTVSVPEPDMKSVTMLNDSTYHININDDICTTLEKRNDTLFIDVVGMAAWASVKEYDDDTIRIAGWIGDKKNDRKKLYKICYQDYFKENEFTNFKLKARIK